MVSPLPVLWIICKFGHPYRKSAPEFHDNGVNFNNGYQSEALAHILELVIVHQDAFVLPLNLGRAGLLQISTPTEKESTAAAASVSEAFDHVSFALEEPVLA
jgi:hypothetical protein